MVMEFVTSTISEYERWSFVMGWVSIACWVIVYTPQIQENYALKSTEGISIWFILIWLGGDAFNLLGGILQNVLFTMISLAGYYCLCDLILIWQWWYYRKYYSNGKPIQVDDDEAGGGAPSEETPLVYRRDRRESNSIISALRHLGHAVDNAINIFSPYQLALIKYTLTTIFVLITAVVAYHTADNASVYVNALKSVDTPNTQTMTLRWDAQLLRWLSALLYLSSRIPQIFKNQQTKCAGLSLALFIFAVGGNVTYVLSILLMDTSSGYLIENASWIVGSVGTIFLDFIVLYQFIKYAPDRRRIEAGYPHHL